MRFKRQATNLLDTIVASVKNNVGGTIAVEIQAQLKANLQAIGTALQTAAVAISTATTGALTGIGGQVTTLTTQEIQDISTAAQKLVSVASNVTATVTIVTTNLSPAVNALLVNEINVIKATVTPLLLPLLTFINVIRTFYASATVTVTGLTAILQAIVPIISQLLSSLGLPVLGLPSA